jgi:dTDP-glucose pyrophosphorylase
LESAFKKYKADIACLIEEVDDPSQYGVINGPYLENGVIDVKQMVEKPKNPRSKHAIIAIYLFKPKIFKYLALARKTSKPQNQLAEAFNLALKNGDRFIGIMLKKQERRIDIGTPQSYSKVLVSLK